MDVNGTIYKMQGLSNMRNFALKMMGMMCLENLVTLYMLLKKIKKITPRVYFKKRLV